MPSKKPNSLNDIVDSLRSDIADHEILPGSRLQEVALAEKFGVSRVVVREALGALEQRGLIKRVPNRGAIVTRVEPDEVMAIFSVREVLEGLCVRLATELGPKEVWRSHLSVFSEELRPTIEAGEVEKYIQALEALRTDCILHAGNPYASHFLDLILDKAKVIARRVTILPGRAEIGRQMHCDMINLMIVGDADAAEVKKREIIASAREWFIRYKSFVI
jgi:DNA-binding GntR family transcriptional regulator